MQWQHSWFEREGRRPLTIGQYDHAIISPYVGGLIRLIVQNNRIGKTIDKSPLFLLFYENYSESEKALMYITAQSCVYRRIIQSLGATDILPLHHITCIRSFEQKLRYWMPFVTNMYMKTTTYLSPYQFGWKSNITFKIWLKNHYKQINA